MSNKKKVTKILKYGIPAVLVIGVIIILSTRKKKQTNDLLRSPLPEPKSDSPSVPSNFPLKKGSRNAKVGDLQRILGVEADQIFGSQTESALKTFAGVTVINSQKELDNLAAKKANAQKQTESVSRAQMLASQFTATPAAYSIYIVDTARWYGYDQDKYGAILYNGKDITQPKGLTLSNADYKIIGHTKAGNVQVQVTRGTLAGTYVVNPSTITLKNK